MNPAFWIIIVALTAFAWVIKAKLIEAQAEADANRVIAESITPELIEMKEAEARDKHGWVTVMGGTPVVNPAA